MGYVHFKCLQSWIDQKTIVRNSIYVTSYLFNDAFCELCKEEYKFTVQNFYGTTLELLDYELHENKNQMVLEQPNQQSASAKTLHVIIFPKDNYQFSFGSSETSSIRNSNPSISSDHAFINTYKGKFYLWDRMSQYGTSILVQKPRKVMKDPDNFSEGELF